MRLACVIVLAILIACPFVHFMEPGPEPSLQKYTMDINGTNGIPLERYLWKDGIYPITGIYAGGQYFDWAAAAYRSIWYIPVLYSKGSLVAFGEKLPPGRVSAVTVPGAGLSVLDVAPTACYALGINGSFDGRSIYQANTSRIVILYIDALGWDRYAWARPVMDNISSLGEPEKACSVYPSISNVNAAAMLTGVMPERSGIDRWENRTLLTDDAISMALGNGVSAAWIDGPSPPVLLSRGIITVNDSNGDGSADDDIVDRAVAEHRNGTRLLYVHIYDMDRALHETGPYSNRSLESARWDDAQAGRLIGSLKPGTLLIVLADHGGHDIAGCKGDHGTLLPQDMLIPMFVKQY